MTRRRRLRRPRARLHCKSYTAGELATITVQGQAMDARVNVHFLALEPGILKLDWHDVVSSGKDEARARNGGLYKVGRR